MSGSVSPASIMSHQNIYSQGAGKQAQQGAVKSGQTGLGKLNLSNRLSMTGKASSGRTR